MRTDIAVDWLYEQMEVRGLQPSARPAPPWTACPSRDCKFDTLNTNESIGRDGRLVSSDLKAELDVQSDGNLVLYYNRIAIWASRTGGGVNQLAMQGDGNLVMYNDNGPTWWTGTSGGGLHLSIQADCNLVVYDGAGNARWSSNTGGCVNRLFVP